MHEANRGRRRDQFAEWTLGVVAWTLVALLGLALSACDGTSGGTATGSATGSSAQGSSDSAGSGNGGTSISTSGTNITLAWTPPTENTDGTPLTDLQGYKIHYGAASQDYTETVEVANPGVANYVVQNLPPGSTYYFAVTAYNSAGLESMLSDEVSATIN